MKTFTIAALNITKDSVRDLQFATVCWDKVSGAPCVLGWHGSERAAEKFAAPNRASGNFKAVSVLPVTELRRSWADRHCGEEHPDHGGPQ